MKDQLVRVVVVALLLGSVGSAQTNSELLQKGIYTHDTVGDIDAAIRIYQQVIAATPPASDLRVQAQRRLQIAETQRRLVLAHAQPAELPTEPNSTARSAPTIAQQLQQLQSVEARLEAFKLQYTPDHPSVRALERTVRELQTRLEAETGTHGAREPLGTVVGRLYRHTWTGVTFDVPEGWKAGDTMPSSDDGEMVTLAAGNPPAFGVAVWMRKEQNDPDGVDQWLNNAPIQKVQQRAGFEGYRLREGSVHRAVIGGQQAMVAIADYTDFDPGSSRATRRRGMAEYMTWIYTRQTHAFFFSRVPADELERLRPQFDAIVYSAIIP